MEVLKPNKKKKTRSQNQSKSGLKVGTWDDVADEAHTESKLNPAQKKESKKNKKVYIVFIGNLDYSTDVDDIRQHFNDAGEVKDIRLLTDKQTGKSRGCAYVEFTNKISHKKAIRMHHSQLKGRRINVEFTSAGRKTARRSTSLKKKNKRLEKFKLPFPVSNNNRTDN